MSYILEALRRAEADRQRGAVPSRRRRRRAGVAGGVRGFPRARRRRRRRWGQELATRLQRGRQSLLEGVGHGG